MSVRNVQKGVIETLGLQNWTKNGAAENSIRLILIISIQESTIEVGFKLLKLVIKKKAVFV